MSFERLTFEDPEVRYHSYHAAQHVVRYAVVKNAVAGKRVLDVACGEGYGARLLVEWGAREVVGVDVFPQSIAAAKRVFGGEGISFLVGDAEQLEKTLDGVPPFDLIVSFETIEHLAHPERFLASLPRLLASDGALIISCPNDRAYSPDNSNPFHLKAYTFEAFKSFTQNILGEASMWMLGAPLLGETNFLPYDGMVQDKHESPTEITCMSVVENTLFLPAQSNLTTNEQTCSHYIGIWGMDVTPNAVISSLSVPSYHEPWNTIDYLSERVKKLEHAVATNYEPALLRLEACEPELERQQEEIGRLRVTNERLTSELEAFSKANIELQDRIRDALQPQIAKLTVEVESLKWAVEHLSGIRDTLRAAHDRLSTETTDLTAQICNVLGPQVATLTAEADTLRQEVDRLSRDCSMMGLQRDALATEKASLEGRIVNDLEPQMATLGAENCALRQEVERLSQAKSMLDLERCTLLAERSVLKDRIARSLEPEIAQLSSEVEKLHDALSKATEERDAHCRNLQAAQTALAELETRKAEFYEPELAKLRSHVEHSKFEKEVQSLRSRLIAYAERSRLADETVTVLQRQLQEAEELRNSWFNPEIERLNRVIDVYETTKREWWDPQLELRAARIAELEATCRD